MSERKIAFAEGEFYHVYNRGNSKQVIFYTAGDYQRFLRLLYLSNSNFSFKIEYLERSDFTFERGEPLVAIGAYCLMPNHFHILLTPCVDGGVSKFMQKVSTGYSMYFNSRHDRSGSLFEGKFKARWVDGDTYLKYLFAYIHLNPVKLIDSTWKEEGIKDAAKAYAFAASFQYSSLADYIASPSPQQSAQARPVQTEQVLPVRTAILTPAAFPDYFATAANHKQELIEWLTNTPPLETHPNQYKVKTKNQT